jgi:hypothetical protein
MLRLVGKLKNNRSSFSTNFTNFRLMISACLPRRLKRAYPAEYLSHSKKSANSSKVQQISNALFNFLRTLHVFRKLEKSNKFLANSIATSINHRF